MFDRNDPNAPTGRPVNDQYLKRGTPEHDEMLDRARRAVEARRAMPNLPPTPDPPKNVDLESPIPPRYIEDREGTPIAALDAAAPSQQIGQAAAKTLNNAVDAATIATLGGTIPLGWKQIDHPDLAEDFKKTGAMHLVSPDGTEFVTFPDAKVGPGEKIKRAFGLSSKAEAVDRIGRAFADNHEITYAGHGRGGALAKLAAESASTWLPNSGDSVRPKTCVAINSTAIPPATYKSLGLAEKNHARTTINVVNERDAADRLKGFRQHGTSYRGDNLVVKQRSIYSGRIAGGPRDGERRGGTTVGNAMEPKAYPDTLIQMEGAIRFGDSARRIGSMPLRQLDSDIRYDLARKHLLAASRTKDAGLDRVQSRGGRE